jgi:(p)ppGpp synthase/HD superfamily hydrolase
MRGYSDRINHALAFAAKHHDTQVRKGLRLPYVTHAANIAVILVHYRCDESVVVSGVLHDVIEDSVRDGYSSTDLTDRIGAKFGHDVLATVLSVTRRRVDDDGIEMSKDDVKDDYLARLASASDAARWVCAAHNLHNAGTVLADLRRTIEPTTVPRAMARCTGSAPCTSGCSRWGSPRRSCRNSARWSPNSTPRLRVNRLR